MPLKTFNIKYKWYWMSWLKLFKVFWDQGFACALLSGGACGEYSFCCINNASRAMEDDRGKHLLKPFSIHAHYKFKYFFTASLNNTYSLHCSTAAPWLHHENKKWCQTVKPYHIAKRCRPLNASDKIVPYKVVNFKQLFKNAESCHIQANIGSNQNCYASLNIITAVKC